MLEEGWPPCPEQGGQNDPRNGEAVSHSIALQRSLGGIHVLQELVKLFLDECPVRLSAIRRAIRAKDAASLHSTALNLREAINQFGPSHAAEVVSRLETIALAHEWIAVDDAYHCLEKAIHRLQPVIAALALEPSP